MNWLASAAFFPWIDIAFQRHGKPIQESLKEHSEMVADYMLTDLIYGSMGAYIVYYIVK